MQRLPKTKENIQLIQSFLTETKKRISEGQELIFTAKASAEIEELSLEYEISTEDMKRQFRS